MNDTPLRAAALRCPTCGRVLTARGECWSCCDRLCRGCGRLTGSAFIDICWSCWFREEQRHQEEQAEATV
jgi:hypothetical protein